MMAFLGILESSYLVETNRTVEVEVATRVPSCLSLLVMNAVLLPN